MSVEMKALELVGSCTRRVFGLSPEERLKRQNVQCEDFVFVVHASAVLSDTAIEWLKNNPRSVLSSAGGMPLAVAVPRQEFAAAACPLTSPGALVANGGAGTGEQFNRKLRRRETLFAMSLDEQGSRAVEKALFAGVYKGVTDLVTKWVWPLPAFWTTLLLSYLRVPPNAVTLAGMALMFAAAWLFLEGDLLLGLGAAWLMTFFDTVDGKLARTTVTSSKLGDRLDHGTDIIHPPIWWACLALGLIERGADAQAMAYACAVILVTYLIGRWTESFFKKRLGFNQFIWEPFDSAFRLVVARRNSILLIITAGLLVGDPASAYIACAGWSVLSVAIQLVRLRMGFAARPIRSWLQTAQEQAGGAGASGPASVTGAR